MDKYIIIVPIYKEKLDVSEKIFLDISFNKNKNVDKTFIAPNDLTTDYYKKNFKNIKIELFDRKFFYDKQTYNKLMLSTIFYSKFLKYEYCVICQTDAILIKNILNIEMQQFDYVGSSWEPDIKIIKIGRKFYKTPNIGNIYSKYKLKVGNGGLSIRKVHSMIKLCEYIETSKFKKIKLNEDIIISICGQDGKILIPGEEFSDKIFLETKLRNYDDLNDVEVYGMHAVRRYNEKIYDQVISGYYSEIHNKTNY